MPMPQARSTPTRISAMASTGVAKSRMMLVA